MALQSSFYNTDGSTRTFPSTKHIATKQHVAVYKKQVSNNAWIIVPVEDFSLINNSVVFDVAPDTAIYSQIEVRVADAANELQNSPSDIALVAGSIANVNALATDIVNINTVATNIASINTTSGNTANINTVAANIANVNATGSNIAAVNTNAANIVDIQNASANAATATTQAGIATTQAGIATTQATNSATSASTATTQATNASNSATSAATSATNAANSAASAANSATAAAASAASLIIDAVPTNGSMNAVSSDGVFDGLATKQDALVSGNNIKTVNGVDILGSGDATVADSTKLPLAGGTMTGAITGLRETKVAMGTTNIDLATGNVFYYTVAGSTTFTKTNALPAPAVNSLTLRLTNAGSAVITWSSLGTVKWAKGTVPPFTASGVDRISLESDDGGVTWEETGRALDIK